jgi:thiamine pyrophosphate-dependent acetolactate synthase large subunit-like protein
MTGAECLLQTLATNGIEVSFMNPGTSEMRFVAALDRVPEIRGVLCLFEGVCPGAADGYARMKRKPAGTGPGEWPRQPAQRPQGAFAGGQHRGRAFHAASEI